MQIKTKIESTLPTNLEEEELLRLPQVLKKVPIGKSTWWAGVASGRFPCAYKLGPKTTVWKKSDIETLIANLASTGGL